MSKGTSRFVLVLQAMGSIFLATTALLAATPALGAEELNRLFLTPQQRADLERRRASNVPAVAAAVAVTVETLITVNGHVRRSGGNTTTWINDQAQNDMPRTTDPATVSLSPVEGEASISLRVGQTLDKGKGEVRDGLNGGEVKAPPRRQR